MVYVSLWVNMALNYTDLITKIVELGKEAFKNTKRICCKKREEWGEIGNSLGIRFRRPTSRTVK